MNDNKKTKLQLAYQVIQEITKATGEDIGRDDIITLMRDCKSYDDETCDNFRFISEDSIDDIMKDELSGDTYVLGCFMPHFIADIVDLPVDEIEKAQTNGSYELLGELMLKNIDEVVDGYASADGYGHHFSHYDGSEHTIDVDGTTWYIFRVN